MCAMENCPLKLCQLCEIDEQKSICIDCNQFFCHRCNKMHSKILATKDHKQLLLQDIQTNDEQKTGDVDRLLCERHYSSCLLFCYSCVENLCEQCLPDHTNCQLNFCKMVRPLEAEKSQHLLIDIQRMSCEIEAKLQAEQEKLEAQSRRKENLISQISNTSTEKLNFIIKTEQALSHEVESLFRVHSESANVIIMKFKDHLNSMLEYRDCVGCFSKRSTSEIVTKNREIKEKIQDRDDHTETETSGNFLVDFVPAKNSFGHLKKLEMFNNLTFKNDSAIFDEYNSCNSAGYSESTDSECDHVFDDINFIEYTNESQQSDKECSPCKETSSVSDGCSAESEVCDKIKKHFVSPQMTASSNYVLCGGLASAKKDGSYVKSQTICKELTEDFASNFKILLKTCSMYKTELLHNRTLAVYISFFAQEAGSAASVHDAEVMMDMIPHAVCAQLPCNATLLAKGKQHNFALIKGLAVINVTCSLNLKPNSELVTSSFNSSFIKMQQAACLSPISALINQDITLDITFPYLSTLSCNKGQQEIPRCIIKLSRVIEDSDTEGLWTQSIYRKGFINSLWNELDRLIVNLDKATREWRHNRCCLYFYIPNGSRNDISYDLVQELFPNSFFHMVKPWLANSAGLPENDFISICLLTSDETMDHNFTQLNHDCIEESVSNWSNYFD